MSASGDTPFTSPVFVPVSPSAVSTPKRQRLDAAEQNARLADSDESLRCLFQPIVDVNGGSQIHGHECLTRFRDSRNLEVSIQTLFDSASTRQLKRMLHSYALRETLHQLAQTEISTLVFINVNPQLFYEDEWHWSEIDGLLDGGKTRPDRIVWEITESHLEDETESASIVRFARECRAMRSQVALDDWGLQSRSLDLLEKVRPEYLKLEKELVTNCSHDHYRAIIVCSVLQMCRQLEIRSILEGIESISDWNWVRQQKADFAQGYYLGRPATRPTQILRPTAAVLGHHFELNVAPNTSLSGVS